MKPFFALVAYLAMGLLLGWGILLLFKGEPWLLLAGLLTYLLAFGRLGCLPRKSH